MKCNSGLKQGNQSKKFGKVKIFLIFAKFQVRQRKTEHRIRKKPTRKIS